MTIEQIVKGRPGVAILLQGCWSRSPCLAVFFPTPPAIYEPREGPCDCVSSSHTSLYTVSADLETRHNAKILGDLAPMLNAKVFAQCTLEILNIWKNFLYKQNEIRVLTVTWLAKSIVWRFKVLSLLSTFISLVGQWPVLYPALFRIHVPEPQMKFLSKPCSCLWAFETYNDCGGQLEIFLKIQWKCGHSKKWPLWIASVNPRSDLLILVKSHISLYMFRKASCQMSRALKGVSFL